MPDLRLTLCGTDWPSLEVVVPAEDRVALAGVTCDTAVERRTAEGGL